MPSDEFPKKTEISVEKITPEGFKRRFQEIQGMLRELARGLDVDMEESIKN